jgi:hypothetical protein
MLLAELFNLRITLNNCKNIILVEFKYNQNEI